MSFLNFLLELLKLSILIEYEVVDVSYNLILVFLLFIIFFLLLLHLCHLFCHFISHPLHLILDILNLLLDLPDLILPKSSSSSIISGRDLLYPLVPLPLHLFLLPHHLLADCDGTAPVLFALDFGDELVLDPLDLLEGPRGDLEVPLQGADPARVLVRRRLQRELLLDLVLLHAQGHDLAHQHVVVR